MSSLNQTNPESWEQHETQIRLERADEFLKLSPAEQQKILAEEKLKFEKLQKEAKEQLGFKKFDPEKAKQSIKHGQKELEEKEKELAKFEQSLHKPGAAPVQKTEEKAKESTYEEKRVFELFNAANENIQKQKPFDFKSVDLNDFGHLSNHVAHMTRLTDYSQTKNLKPDEILARLQENKTSADKIGLQVDINMGEDKNNELGLTNLSFEIPLADLLSGHFIEKIAKFTNLVFFAALMHDRQQKQRAENDKKTVNPEKKSVASSSADKPQETISQLAGLKVAENGGLHNARGVFEQGNHSTIAFSCNNGFIWGTFEQQGVPSDPKQLQEALDKNKQDK